MSEPANPFITLEAVMEHIQSARHGNVAYHLEAAEGGIRRLFQALVLRLPGDYASPEGEPTDTIMRQLGAEG